MCKSPATTLTVMLGSFSSWPGCMYCSLAVSKSSEVTKGFFNNFKVKVGNAMGVKLLVALGNASKETLNSVSCFRVDSCSLVSISFIPEVVSGSVILWLVNIGIVWSLLLLSFPESVSCTMFSVLMPVHGRTVTSAFP